jgi:hypothetical protein
VIEARISRLQGDGTGIVGREDTVEEGELALAARLEGGGE